MSTIETWVAAAPNQRLPKQHHPIQQWHNVSHQAITLGESLTSRGENWWRLFVPFVGAFVPVASRSSCALKVAYTKTFSHPVRNLCVYA